MKELRSVSFYMIFAMPNGKTYRIKRSRSKTTKEVELFQVDSANYDKDNTNWEKLTDRTDTLTDEKILAILKINQRVFENSSYFKQDEKTNLASLPPEKRKDVIKEMLHLGPWEKYKKESSKVTVNLEKNVTLSNSIISSLGDPEREIDICDIDLSNIEVQISAQNSEIDSISKDLDAKKENLNKLKNESSKEYPELVASLDKNKILLQKLEKEESTIISNKKQKLTSIELDTKKYNELNLSLSEKSGELEQLLSNSVPQVDEDSYNASITKLCEIKAKLTNRKAEFAIVAKDLPEDDNCPPCSTPLHDIHRLEATNIKQERLNNIASEVNKLDSEYNSAKSEKDDLDNKIKEYNLYKSKIGMAESDKTKLTTLVNEYTSKLKMANEAIVSYDEILAEKVKLKQDVKTKVSSLKERIDKIKANNNDDAIVRLSSDITVVENSLKNKKTFLNTLFENKGKLANKLEANKKALNQLKQEKQNKLELDRKYNVASIGTSCFSSSGAPAMIIHTVLDSLQNKTNSVLSILRPNIQVQFIVSKENSKGDLDETLDMKFFNDGIEFDFGDLSGGEKACVSVALKFGTAIVNRERCDAKIDMLMLDEVDQALDAAGIDSFFDVLKTWSKHMTIMVISHNEQLKAKFNSYILVEKNNKVASASAMAK